MAADLCFFHIMYTYLITCVQDKSTTPIASSRCPAFTTTSATSNRPPALPSPASPWRNGVGPDPITRPNLRWATISGYAILRAGRQLHSQRPVPLRRARFHRWRLFSAEEGAACTASVNSPFTIALHKIIGSMIIGSMIIGSMANQPWQPNPESFTISKSALKAAAQSAYHALHLLHRGGLQDDDRPCDRSACHNPR